MLPKEFRWAIPNRLPPATYLGAAGELYSHLAVEACAESHDNSNRPAAPAPTQPFVELHAARHDFVEPRQLALKFVCRELCGLGRDWFIHADLASRRVGSFAGWC